MQLLQTRKRKEEAELELIQEKIKREKMITEQEQRKEARAEELHKKAIEYYDALISALKVFFRLAKFLIL